MSETSANNPMEKTLPRPDVRQKVTGTARYTADQYPAKVLHARAIRFPFGKGLLAEADVQKARSLPGVISVEVQKGKEASYAGAVVGRIVAESKDALEDAMEALGATYAMMPPRTNPMKLYAGVPQAEAADEAKLKEIFEGEGVKILEATYTTQVQTHSCLEPHGTVADVRQDSAEAWVSTQAVMAQEDAVSNTTGLPASKVTVHSEFVGGGFGSKFSLGAEGTMACRVSKEKGRPVRAILNRREEHSDGGNRPGSIQYMKIAVKDDGGIVGGRVHLVNIVDADGGGGGIRNPNYYKFGNIVRTEDDLSLNGGKPQAFRAPGFPQGSFALESMMDELAAAVKMDPVAFRKLNETSERRKSQFDQGAELIGWKDRKPDGTTPGRIKVGYGCAAASWGNGKGKCSADCEIHRTGEVEVRVGIQDIGTGASAVVTDTAAWHLGLPRTMVTGKVGNSDFPPGPGSGGSVTTRMTVPAVRDSAENALTELKKELATVWKTEPEKIAYKEGVFTNPTTSQSVPWKDACAMMSSASVVGHGRFNEEYWGGGNSDTVQFVKVEVDSETGVVKVKKVVAIQAAGQICNKLTAENQICGGVIQGISFALFEQRILDPVTGGQVNADFINYKIAGPVDIPEIVPVLDIRDTDTGARSIGEPTTIPTAGAIANAVANALGVRVRHLPITPKRVLEAMQEQKGKTA
ncbi:MAG TPA: xanthine dehydrogenase family protein molybdopterin-binding subunit [Candidatus Sumerlaeota bacterium]|nr:xanthine dehydrogenase family protein molybdopterin-binding subunit [Candidatus Sumerlaeota bacterium]